MAANAFHAQRRLTRHEVAGAAQASGEPPGFVWAAPQLMP